MTYIYIYIKYSLYVNNTIKLFPHIFKYVERCSNSDVPFPSRVDHTEKTSVYWLANRIPNTLAQSPKFIYIYIDTYIYIYICVYRYMFIIGIPIYIYILMCVYIYIYRYTYIYIYTDIYIYILISIYIYILISIYIY